MPIKQKVKTISAFNAKTLPASGQPLSASNEQHVMQVDVDNLTVRYGAEIALDRVSFCIHKGEFLGLIGPNGAGKTMLLRTVLGLVAPTTGHVRKSRAVIGYVPQRGALYNGTVPVSALEVVRLGAKGSKVRAMQALAEVQLVDAAHARFNELSGGQQQRVAIAKALAAQADILILDEPATGIDERAQAAFYDLLRGLHQKGITIVMISHEVDAVLKLVTRVICLNRSILYDGSPQHFEADKYLPKAYKLRHLQLHHHHKDTHA